MDNDGALRTASGALNHENQRRHWSLGERVLLVEKAQAGRSWAAIAESLHRTAKGCEQKFQSLCSGEGVEDLPAATLELIAKYKRRTAARPKRSGVGVSVEMCLTQYKALSQSIHNLRMEFLASARLREFELAIKIHSGELQVSHLVLMGLSHDACQRIARVSRSIGRDITASGKTDSESSAQ